MIWALSLLRSLSWSTFDSTGLLSRQSRQHQPFHRALPIRNEVERPARDTISRDLTILTVREIFHRRP